LRISGFEDWEGPVWWSGSRKAALNRETYLTECGDASACLKLRIPLIQRDAQRHIKSHAARALRNGGESIGYDAGRPARGTALTFFQLARIAAVIAIRP
jgi:hypothetical protein